MNPDNQITADLFQHWNGLLVDTSGDEVSEGGQSLRELERLEAFEAFLATLPGKEIPTFHHFSDGIYMRQINAPKDSVLIGHEHQHECLNLMLSGRVLTVNNGRIAQFDAPLILKSGPRTRKASIVVEDMIWVTVHPNPDNETDIEKLEKQLFIPSQTFLKHKSRNEPDPTAV